MLKRELVWKPATRTRSAHIWCLTLAASAACGNVEPQDTVGEPIFVIGGELQGLALSRPEGEFRGWFGWLSFGGGDYPACIEETGILVCAHRTTYESVFTLFDKPIEPNFPAFEVPFYELPNEKSLLDYKGARLALGGLALYDDRNGNRSLDPVNPEDVEPVDRLLAESLIVDLKSAVVFREGPLHPMWEILLLFGCPPPPEGISVAVHDGRGHCTISADNSLLLTASNDERTAQVLCGEGIAVISRRDVGGFPSVEPQPGARIECSTTGRSFSFYGDEGRYCDRFNRTTYALEGCGPMPFGSAQAECWDLREAPPSWWPCNVTR